MTAVADQRTVLQLLKRACATKEDGKCISALLSGQGSASNADEVNQILERALGAVGNSAAVDAVVALRSAKLLRKCPDNNILVLALQRASSTTQADCQQLCGLLRALLSDGWLGAQAQETKTTFVQKLLGGLGCQKAQLQQKVELELLLIDYVASVTADGTLNVLPKLAENNKSQLIVANAIF